MSKTAVIDSIRGKVDRMVDDNRRLRREAGKLVAQRDRLKADNGELTKEVEELKRRVAVLELREAMGGSTDEQKIARARVNRLMREVDKCLALLNK